MHAMYGYFLDSVALLVVSIILYHFLFLSLEINLKQQLVDQLEKAQNSLYTMKIQYEEKVHVLQTQIKNVESERDKVLKEMSKCGGYFYRLVLIPFCFALLASHRDSGRSQERLKEIKVKYERQLGELKSELKTLKSARKEHAKAMKKNVCYIVNICQCIVGVYYHVTF